MTIALATVACAMAVFAAPSFAKEKVYFGHFTASKFGQEITPSSPLEAKGTGEVDELKLGPLTIECEPTAGTSLTAKGEVEEERSSDFTTTVKLKGCKTEISFGHGGTYELARVSFGSGIKMQFHANGSLAVGNPSGEVKILETAAVQAKVPGHKCKLFIPAQTLPLADEKNEEHEYQAAEYGTETEAVEERELKKYPSGFKERLDISWELKAIHAYVPVTPGHCEYKKGEEGKYEPEGEGLPNRVEFTSGKFEGELEEVEIKNGELGFDPTREP